jgi:tRNA(fMet)-specific endonuclease VapC
LTHNAALLDTNAVIAYMKHDVTLIALIQRVDAVYIPAIVAGELWFGAENSERQTENRAVVDAFLGENRVLDCTAETARIYGRIAADLRRSARIIPQNDLWIAAIALEYQLPLFTRDKHFGFITELPIQPW